MASGGLGATSAVAHIVMAFVVMAYTVMAYVVMAYIVMASGGSGAMSAVHHPSRRTGERTASRHIFFGGDRRCSYGLYSYGLCGYGLCTYGLCGSRYILGSSM